ncbi:MAG: imidazole glycerol phosphate synthase subunit HisH [Nitrospirota bacterium]
MIAIIDYGMGNLRSVHKGFEILGYDAVITSDPVKIADASHIVLPGVGAFPDCMKNLEDLRLIDIVYKSIKIGKPFLGICLGLQILFTESEEFGIHKGLDIVKGKVVRFSSTFNKLKVPHIGWNSINIKKDVPILNNIPDKSYLYFVHSYYTLPDNENLMATTTEYGVEFVSSIQRDNIFACQFHPEKSHNLGLKILENFGRITS